MTTAHRGYRHNVVRRATLVVTRIAYPASLLAVVAVLGAFVTPDAPWWLGLAVIAGMFAVIGVARVAEDLRR